MFMLSSTLIIDHVYAGTEVIRSGQRIFYLFELAIAHRYFLQKSLKVL